MDTDGEESRGRASEPVVDISYLCLSVKSVVQSRVVEALIVGRGFHHRFHRWTQMGKSREGGASEPVGEISYLCKSVSSVVQSRVVEDAL